MLAGTTCIAGGVAWRIRQFPRECAECADCRSPRPARSAAPMAMMDISSMLVGFEHLVPDDRDADGKRQARSDFLWE